MYVSMCWFANRKNSSAFEFSLTELKKLAGLSTTSTAKKALDGLVDRGLLSISDDDLILHDPYTGEPLHVENGDPSSDPANYYGIMGQGRATRLNLNTGNPQQVEQLLRECNAEPIPQNNGELKIICPFHSDQNPSCSVSPTKRVFYCFGCQKAGTLTQLVMQLRGVGKGTAIKIMAESAGQAVEFHEPDKNAEAIYSYHDTKGDLKKQVIRYPGKAFSQRRPGRSGGWIWKADRVPPMLYNLEGFKLADVVIVCEGEKDCDTITGLKLHPARCGDVVATTSGNAESWEDQLADHLKGKKVALMPDADEAGEDVSDFVAGGGSKRDLVQRIGKDWVQETEHSHLYYHDDPHGTV
jgi:hypothetical protein